MNVSEKADMWDWFAFSFLQGIKNQIWQKLTDYQAEISLGSGK